MLRTSVNERGENKRWEGTYKGRILGALGLGRRGDDFLGALALGRRGNDLLGEARVTDSLVCLIGETFGGGK